MLIMPRTAPKKTGDNIICIIAYRKCKLSHVTHVCGRHGCIKGLVEDHVCPALCVIICYLKHATHRHCAASMQAVDGGLGFSVSLVFYKSAPCNKTNSVTAHCLLQLNSVICACGHMRFTFAGAVRSSQHSALVYAAKGLKQSPHVLVALLLSQHAHKQLPVL